MTRVAAIGAGSWGTAVAAIVAGNVPTVLWARRPELAAAIDSRHENADYLRDIPLIGRVGGVLEDRLLAAERFNTVIGVLLLVIMLVSPDGLTGIIVRVRRAVSRSVGRGSTEGSTLDGPSAPTGVAASLGQPPVGP